MVQCSPLTHDHFIAHVLKDDAQRLQELHGQSWVAVLRERLQKEGEHVVLHEVAARERRRKRRSGGGKTNHKLKGYGEGSLEDPRVVLVSPNEDLRHGPEGLNQLPLVAVASALQPADLARFGAGPQQLNVDVPGSDGGGEG